MFLLDAARNLSQIEPLRAVICKSKGAMTDQPSPQSQPSMEDILASIRRIIDDEEVKTSAPSSAISSVPKPQETKSPFAIDDDEAAQALAEYDAALATESVADDVPDPFDETIFPQREGALWRRVAGHPLSEGEADPLPADDTLELTETVDDVNDDGDAYELNELLETAGDSDPVEDRRVLDDVAASAPSPTEPDPSILGIGAMTGAGLGAAAAFSGNTMDRITERMSTRDADEDDGEILDLTRGIDTDGSIEELASSMSGNPRFEHEELKQPVFERVDVPEMPDVSFTAPHDDEAQMDRSFETAAVTGLSDDYASALNENDDVQAARERALDDRFYRSEGYEEKAPDIDGSYAASLGGTAEKPADPVVPKDADDLDTVGGLVRDALRSRLPAVPQDNTRVDPLVSEGAGDSAARSLATLARYDAHAPRRIYGGIKITDDDDSPTIEGMVQDTLRPMLRDWLNDNLPTLVENMVKQEVDRISARSRRFVRDDDS